MDTYMIERPGGDETVAWAHHPVTRALHRQALSAQAQAHQVLLNACLNSTDTHVVKLAVNFRAASELVELFREPTDKDSDDEPTDD